MGIIEKIKEIEAEMARTQKNKATGALHYPLHAVFQFILVVCLSCFSLINSLIRLINCPRVVLITIYVSAIV